MRWTVSGNGVPVSLKKADQTTRTVIIELKGLEAAEKGYQNDGCQVGLNNLEDCAVRELRCIVHVLSQRLFLSLLVILVGSR